MTTPRNRIGLEPLWTLEQNTRLVARGAQARTPTDSTDNNTLSIPMQEVMPLRTAFAGSCKAVGAGLVQNGRSNKAAAMACQVKRAGRGV